MELVCNKAIDFNYVCQILINLVPSARSIYGIVPTLRHLLTIQALDKESSVNKYVSPFGMRNPTHPFIIVLTSRPECWNVLTHQIESLYHHPDNRVRCVATRIVKPFLQFLFLEPQQTASYQSMRYGVQGVLLDACSNDNTTEDVLQFLIHVLPAFQIKSAENLSILLQFLTQLMHVICTKLSCISDDLIGSLLSFSLSILRPSLKKSLNVSRLLQGILSLVENCEMIPVRGNLLFLLSELLMEIELDISLDVLIICKVVIEKDGKSICKLTRKILILPLLQLYSTPLEQHNSLKLRNLSFSLISTIEELNDDYAAEMKKLRCRFITSEGFYSQLFVNLIDDFTKNIKLVYVWLDNVLDSLNSFKVIPLSITNLVAAIFVSSTEQILTRKCLSLLVEIGKKNNSQSPNFLPLLLYQLGRAENAEQRLLIMEHIPLMARHKICIGPILKTIQMLSGSLKLRPVAIRLMVQLWQLQDRCFPQLMKLLTNTSTICSDDIIIAQASAIKEICHLRPEQHGEDLLSPVSDILNKCSDVNMAPAAALALEALYMMCEAEVIDIKSAWTVLAAKLSSDTRPAVIEKICDFFALVPSLSVNSADYDQFMCGIISKLWLYCQDINPRIQGSAYQALASYDLNQFYLDLLPSQITEDFRLEAEKNQKSLKDISETNFHIPVPSLCYTRILKCLNKEVLNDYGVFLSGLVGKEVADLPRGIYHLSLQQKTVASIEGKTINSIPTFILSEYEKTQQPGLRSSLAVSLLFCYNPPIKVGRGGRPRRHYIISHGKNYQQMFETLLHEVPIQPSEWHRCMLMPQAWTSFMDRLYSTMLESRKVDLEFQTHQGQIDEVALKEKISTNWLWIRDVLTDIIKNASRQNPSMQSNSVFALAGLAVAVNRYVGGLEQEELKTSKDLAQHLSHKHWCIIVLDTVTCIMDIQFEPEGDIFSMCQQGDLHDRKPATLLARTSACVALGQLVPVIMLCDTDRIQYLIFKLVNGLPGRLGCEESPVSQFHFGLASGMFLGRLFEEHFSDICGTKGLTEIWKGLTMLEDCCFNTQLENRSGSILGLGLCISGLCQEGKTDSRVHVIEILDQMLILFNTTDITDRSYQAICVALACITGSAFSNNIISSQKINSIVDVLNKKHEENLQVSGIALAVGMICYNLHKIGDLAAETLNHQLQTTWMKELTDEVTPPLVKVSMLNGLFALVGSERTLISVASSTGAGGSNLITKDVVMMALKIISTSNDIGMQGNSAWMLGHFFLSACAVTETRASAPPNYSYLKETSLLRSLVDLLLEAGRYGPETISNEKLKIVLRALQDEISRLLPPLNWVGVLSPLMRLEYECEVKCLCIKLAVMQCISSPTATTFIATWLTSPLFNTLSNSCKTVLYNSLPLILKSVPSSVLDTFLEKGCMEPFTDIPVNLSDCVAVLEGLNKALLVCDPPKTVTTRLYHATQRFYDNCPSICNIPLLSNMAKCLSSIPDDLFDAWTMDDFSSQISFVKCIFIRCHLVALGRQPITILNSCLDATINNKDSDYEKVFSIVCHCFYSTIKSEATGSMNLLQWLLELIGHIRNLALGVIPLRETALPLKQVLEFTIGIVSAALSIWTTQYISCMIGIKPNIMLHDVDNLISEVDMGCVSLTRCLQCLPYAVANIKTEPWLQILPKIINWLIFILQLPDNLISQDIKQLLRDSLHMMRDSNEFKKASVWTQAFSV